MDDRVVITGTGISCSLGYTVQEVWDSLLAGRSGIRSIEGFDAGGFDCRVAAQIHDLRPLALEINPRDSRIMGTHAYMLMKSARDAYREARLDTASIPGEEIGFFAGMGMVDYTVEDLLPAVLKSLDSEGELDYDAFFSEGYKEIYPLWPLSMLNNISFCQVAISLNIKGDNTVLSPHADSGAQAVAEGMKTVLEGKSRVALAGGVSEKVSPLSLARAHLCGILNMTDDHDGIACKPFSAKRGGTILGEGSGVLALELQTSAKERGVRCLASVTGYGTACEPHGRFSGPTTRAISFSMKRALESADLRPSDIDVIVAHGDGTITGDGNEIEAVQQVFEGCFNRLAVFSSKGALGLLHAGAPVVDMILGILMFQTGRVPATVTSLPLESTVRFNLASGQHLPAYPRKILINCQSYEGQSASLIIEAADQI